MVKKNWDIFCKIVDNFGDIGVCWRLAKQLQAEHGLCIRLWIDDLSAAQTIIPDLNKELHQQIIDEIYVLSWRAKADFTHAADVVIEAFACELPAAYLSAMAQKKSKWINLEYLSAEAWVADFHAKPSPQANGLIRYFYFPGFTENTGGLIRELNINKFGNKQSHLTTSFLQKRESILDGNSTWIPAFTGMMESEDFESRLKISLFCYLNAPIHDLFTALQANKNKVNVYIPASGILPKVADFFGKNKIEIGEKITKNNLTVQVLPFLSQLEYDQLLSACDINFVRGEDSWVRAIWAGKPFIWQPYFQEENTHIKKLNAFLQLFYADFEANKVVCQAHSDWVEAQLSPATWQDYLHQLPNIAEFTSQQSQKLKKQVDLASKLVGFCNNIAQT